jgi:hypothetical protein
VVRIVAALSLLLAAAESSAAWPNPPPTKPPASPSPNPPPALRVAGWFSLEPASKPPHANGITLAPEPDRDEHITVYAPRNKSEFDKRNDLLAHDQAYEPANSAAAQTVIPDLAYASPEQQRLMSIKTDLLGLCGALGGYIQCPNKPP